MNHLELALHHPRKCASCRKPSTALVADRCRQCRTPGESFAPPVPAPPCEACGRPLLLIRPGRVQCERCRLDMA